MTLTRANELIDEIRTDCKELAWVAERAIEIVHDRQNDHSPDVQTWAWHDLRVVVERLRALSHGKRGDL